jgi:hypothetical protein
MLTLTQNKPLLGRQLNRAHPLARGLVGCWPMNEGTGGQIADLSGYRNHLSFAGVWSQSGAYVNDPSHRLLADGPVLSQSEGTFIFKIARQQATDNYAPWVNIDNSSNSSTHEMLLGYPATGANVRSYPNFDQDSADFWQHSSGDIDDYLSLYEYHIIAIVWKNGERLEGYLDGVLDGSLGGDKSWTASDWVSGERFCIGATYGIEYSTRAIYQWAHAYNRALSAAQIASLYAEPFQMFRRAGPVFFAATKIRDYTRADPALLGADDSDLEIAYVSDEYLAVEEDDDTVEAVIAPINIAPQIMKPPLGRQLNRAHPLANGLVACWLFNEGVGGKVADLSGNKNDGALAGNASWVAGKFGSAIDLDGVDGTKISVSNPPFGAGQKQFTVVTHFRLDELGRRQGVFCTPTNSAILARFREAGDLRCDINTDLGASALTSIYNPSLGEDLHWAIVYIEGDNQYHYINGRFVVSGSVSGSIDALTSINIGSFHDIAGRHLNGPVRYCYVYDRALSAAEIASLYAEPFAMFRRSTPFISSAYQGRVPQTTTGGYAIHQFKDKATGVFPINVTWNGRTSKAPKDMPVSLQIYNRTLTTWETLDVNGVAEADVDFDLVGQVPSRRLWNVGGPSFANIKPLLGRQLNRAHPLSRGLVGCWLMNEGVGGKVFDLSNRIEGTFGAGTASPSWLSGPLGKRLYFDGSNDYISGGTGSDSLQLGSSDFTVVFSVQQTSLHTGYIFSTKNGTPRYSATTLADGDLLFLIHDGVDGASEGPTSTPLADFKLHHIAWRVDYSRTDGFQWFIDGVLDTSRDADPTNVGSTDSGRPLGIGTRDALDNGSHGKFYMDYLYVYNRALSATEIASLYAEPFQVFKTIRMLPLWNSGTPSDYYDADNWISCRVWQEATEWP